MLTAICIKSYIDEEILDEFLNGEIDHIHRFNIIEEGKKYTVTSHYDKEYFKLIETKDEKTN